MIYLDNASTTKIDDRVLQAMMPYLTDQYGNAGNLHSAGTAAAQAVSKAREQVADLIGASKEQIIFTSGGSEANNMVFGGLADYLLYMGKTTIITSQIEHDSVLNAVENLKTKFDFDVVYVKPDSNGEVLAQDVSRAIRDSSKVGLVSIMHMNNETGISNRINSIGAVCKQRGILFHTDCVQSIGCLPVNVDKMNCDFLSISSHKIHGGKGVGALFARDKRILSPLIFGGNSQEYGLRGGTENVAGIVGFGEACDILGSEREKDAVHVDALRQSLCEKIRSGLGDDGDLFHLNGDLNHNVSKTVNMRFDKVDGETLLYLLDADEICVSAGSACRSREQEPSYVLTAMGLTPEEARNSIRVSLSKMNTMSQIDKAAEIIARDVKLLRYGMN